MDCAERRESGVKLSILRAGRWKTMRCKARESWGTRRTCSTPQGRRMKPNNADRILQRPG